MSGLGASALACAVLAGCAAGACAIPWARWLLARRGIPEGKGHPAWAWATVPAGAAAFVLVVRTSGWGIEAAELLALEWVLLTSCVTDLSAHLIPNPCVAGAVLIRAAYLLCVGASAAGPAAAGLLADSLVGATAVGAPLILVTLVMGRVSGEGGMGGGDLKLLSACGLYVGWSGALVLLLVACLSGVAFALLRALVTRTRVEPGTSFPFGPPIAFACWVSVLMGDGALTACASLLR